MTNFSWLLLSLLIPILSFSPALAQSAQDVLSVDTKSFRLVRDQQGYRLQYDVDKHLRVPQAWLMPPDELKEESLAYVSSFNYDEQVTAFPIGNGRIGLHVSSYEIQREGSAQAAAGRDIFLMIDPKTRRLHPGGILFGITKDRVRSMGCFFATFHRFVIGDINNDHLIDVGVIREKITCEEVYDPEREVGLMKGPFYEQYPVRWYVFEWGRPTYRQTDHWRYSPDFDGKHPLASSLELPLIGLAKSPVDFVKEVYRGKLVKRRPIKAGKRIGERQTMILSYSCFGPQALAYELIGFQWYQWNPCGHPDPKHIDTIWVVVYKDISIEEVKKLYPVVEDLRQDYRYVNYDEAMQYLDRHINEFKEYKKSDPDAQKFYSLLLSEFQETRRKIVENLSK